MTKEQIKRRIEGAIAKLAGVRTQTLAGIVPPSLTAGKLYEAHVLAIILENLTTQENLTVVFRRGQTRNVSRITLRSKGGPIEDAYPHFDLLNGNLKVGEVWTDIEFLALSYTRSGRGRALTPGDFHELDIMVVKPNVRRRPPPEDILLGVECKNTQYAKEMLRQILGVRRELSFLCAPTATAFQNWPRRTVPADPPSCLAVYASDGNAGDYAKPGEMFGINFYYETL